MTRTTRTRPRPAARVDRGRAGRLGRHPAGHRRARPGRRPRPRPRRPPRAAELKALGSTEPVGARRAMALGHLARHQPALDLPPGRRGERPDRDRLPAARAGGAARPPRRTDGRRADPVCCPTGRLEEGQRLVLLDQVTAWCAQTHTKVTIKPVIDSRPDRPGLRDPGPDPRPDHPARPHLRLPLVHPSRPALPDRPHRPLRPPRRHRGPTPARPHPDRQPRRPVRQTPPTQDPRQMALPDHRTRGLRVDQPERPQVPTRPDRHPRHSPPSPTVRDPPHRP